LFLNNAYHFTLPETGIWWADSLVVHPNCLLTP